jgi:hypothetical protein
LAGFAPDTSFSFPGAAKLDSFGPAPPANPLPSFDPNTLPLERPPNPEVAPLPNPKPVAGLSPDKAPNPLTVVVEVGLGGFAAANAPKPDVVDCELPPNMLGLDAPRLPNGDVLAFAKDAKPELANADVAVCGLSLTEVDLCEVVSSLSIDEVFVTGFVAKSTYKSN